MSRLIAVVVATTLCAAAYAAPPTDAPPPPTEQSIDTLLAASKAQRNVDNALKLVSQAMRRGMYAALQGQTLSDEQKKTIEAIPVAFEKVMREELSWDKMRPMMVQIYEETYTQSEVDGLIAFYRSPTGIAFVDKGPVVMQKSQAQMQARLAPLIDRMRAETQKALEDLKAAK